MLRKFVAWQSKNKPERDLVRESLWKKLILTQKPKLAQLTCLKQREKVKLLNLIYGYLSASREDEIKSNVGIWIYSILATLELPLSPSDCHELRELAKVLAVIRSRFKSNSEATYLNLCICIIAKVFGQMDLADV